VKLVGDAAPLAASAAKHHATLGIVAAKHTRVAGTIVRQSGTVAREGATNGMHVSTFPPFLAIAASHAAGIARCEATIRKRAGSARMDAATLASDAFSIAPFVGVRKPVRADGIRRPAKIPEMCGQNARVDLTHSPEGTRPGGREPIRGGREPWTAHDPERFQRGTRTHVRVSSAMGKNAGRAPLLEGTRRRC